MPPVHTGVNDRDNHALPLDTVDAVGFGSFGMARGDICASRLKFQGRPIHGQTTVGNVGLRAQAVINCFVQQQTDRLQLENSTHFRQRLQTR